MYARCSKEKEKKNENITEKDTKKTMVFYVPRVHHNGVYMCIAVYGFKMSAF